MRDCVECGAPVAGDRCDACGAARPAVAAPVAATTPRLGHGGAVVVPVEDDDDDPDALRTAEQPWHPFEQPSWLDAAADPRHVAPGGFAGSAADGSDVLGVGTWQVGQEAVVEEERRRSWLLGALAGVAVVVVLAAVAFFALGDRSSATPGTPPPAPVTAATVSATPTAASPAPTSDTEPTPDRTPVASPTTAATPAPVSTDPTADPMGGPARDIACAPGYVVQIASAGDDAAFVARVAELRAAGRLPPEVAVARTATSCAIFAGQSNSIVLYAGPYAAPYDGCPARLAGAADSFVKGTTPETATEYVSCLCPAQVVTVPTLDAVGQTDVWVGELQRVLGNRLDIPILDLAGNWGTYTESTAEAVRQFQTRTNLPVTGTVDAGTWQALQQAGC
ncbi:peptidoglycan-binding domain-containing protein [Nakamurella deserti]|uniref:peptidoglycan-binding domain-containing protein n=1 Tax=Nakamurella deserti TaxID=2164074 RepID=UPI000DBE1113|nr:peptidoglycan-binding domain-containing protein [Nakamurella deserti]